LIPNKELLKAVQETTGKKDVKELEFRHYVKKVGEKRLLARIFGGIDGLVILCLQELIEVADSQTSRLPKTQIINVQSEKLQLAGGLFEDLETSVVPILDQAGGTLEALVNSTDVRASVREAVETLQSQFNSLRKLIKSYQKVRGAAPGSGGRNPHRPDRGRRAGSEELRFRSGWDLHC